MKVRFIGFIVLLCACALPLAAQPLTEVRESAGGTAKADDVTGNGAVVDIGEIIVTATRTPRKAGTVPASVSVIGKEDIRLMPAQYMDEVISHTTGVYTRRSKMQDTTIRIGMRGLSGGTYCLVMVDGQPLNDAYDNDVQWPHLSKDAVERVEVVRGPFSSLYGQNAMGGVVNVITSAPKERELAGRVGYGTYNTMTAHAHYDDLYQVGASWLDSIGISVSGDVKKSDGYRNQYYVTSFSSGAGTVPVTGWEKTTGTTGSTSYLLGDMGENTWEQSRAGAKVYLNFTHDTSLVLTYGFSRYAYDYEDARSYLRDASGNSVTSGKVQIDDGGSSYNKTISEYSFTAGPGENTRHMSYAKFSTKFGEALFMASAGYNRGDSWYMTPSSGGTLDGGKGSKSSTNPKETLFLDTQLDIPFTIPMLTKSWITVGASHRQDHAEADQWYVSDWSDQDSSRIVQVQEMSGRQRLEAAYAQLELGLHRTLKVYGGVRYDYWRNYDGSSIYNTVSTTTYAITGTTGEIDYENTTASQVSPRASIVYTPGFAIGDIWMFRSVWASYGRGFNAPSIYRLYRTWTYGTTTYRGNPDLDPERCDSWEVGVEQMFAANHIRLAATYFESKIDNLVYYMQIDSATKQYQNAGEGKVRGVELEARARIFMFELFGNYTRQDTEITENEADSSIEGMRFQFVPLNMYNLGLYARFHYFAGSVSWRSVGKVYSSDKNTDTAEGVYGAYDPVRLLDARINVYPCEWCTVSLSCNNILDREYYVSYKAQGRTFNFEVEMRI